MYLQAQSILGDRMDLGRTALRLIVGPLFVGHGTQKLFGWFGGHGLEGTGAFFEKLGLRPGKRQATAAGAAEAVGGALLTLGALTPVAAGLITGTMLTAIQKVHAPKGPWVTNGGYEYNLTLIAVMATLAEVGPGRPSVDAASFPRVKGNGWALAQFTGAAAGAALLTSERMSPEPALQEADVAAERQNRFVRENAEVPAGS
jgi:putative oxidoreductase